MKDDAMSDISIISTRLWYGYVSNVLYYITSAYAMQLLCALYEV